MDVIFCFVKLQLALIFSNDIVIFKQTVEQHLSHPRRVLTLLRGTNVARKLQIVYALLRPPTTLATLLAVTAVR